jgi:hypothetical protein
MTETEWFHSDSPRTMLKWLRGRGSERKLRLFAVACFRRVLHLPMADSARAALEVAERFADRQASKRALAESARRSYFATRPSAHGSAVDAAVDAARLIAYWKAYPNGKGAADEEDPWGAWKELDKEEVAAQCELLREVFGNPFRPVAFEPAWLALSDGIVRRLAEEIYEERAYDRLLVLADALEDAGACEEIVAHCRRVGGHVRGCWAIDVVRCAD